MDEVARVCGQAKERFTSIQTDISKVETELEKAHDWSARVQNKIDRLEVLVQRLEGSRRMMWLEMGEMIGNMNGLLELNWQMIQSIHQLRTSQVHSWNNPIVIDDEPPVEDVLDTALVPVLGLVKHRLVPIEELMESVEDSKEESGDEVWEITCEEFIGSSPEL